MLYANPQNVGDTNSANAAMTTSATSSTPTNNNNNSQLHHQLTSAGQKDSASGSTTPTANNNVTQSTMKSKLAAVDVPTLCFMVLNFFSSTCIVVINKIAMDKYGFKFATTLTCFHLVATFILLLISSKLGLFEIKRLPVRDVSKLAAGTMGFICLTNLSLQFNSIGFYQVMKVMTTPTVVVIESLFYQKYLDNNLKISLLPVCLGVIITVATDFRLNFVGSMYAIAGVVITSLYQIWSAVFILPFIPIFDNYSVSSPDSIWDYKFNQENLSIILITGFFGFLVNISIFLVIGRSSALSYNILGHCKTVVVLLSDYILFGRPATFKSSIGILLTLSGVFWYTSLKLEKARLEKEARERAPPPPKVIDGDVKNSDASDDEKIRLSDSRRE